MYVQWMYVYILSMLGEYDFCPVVPVSINDFTGDAGPFAIFGYIR
jgi:hypothetical protein